MKRFIKTVYISIDKKEFNNKEDCIKHEYEIMQQKIKESTNIIEAVEAKDLPPYNYHTNNSEDYSYRWFMIKNEKGIEELSAAFPGLSNYHQTFDTYINNWICLEYKKDNPIGTIFVHTLIVSTDRYTNLLNRLIEAREKR